ncbi:hypothetical protein Pmani_024457 [Petrolisthes manimaculis]|uniref:Uncharacterized protein n=1 Tax=Petrolisthes manimaculis TaxID=1843537 RepID=A0AAE1TYN4_9EUCA|nr:hypothetical protein Pmani_024457 [Petrolisthes manimaculis]
MWHSVSAVWLCATTTTPSLPPRYLHSDQPARSLYPPYTRVPTRPATSVAAGGASRARYLHALLCPSSWPPLPPLALPPSVNCWSSAPGRAASEDVMRWAAPHALVQRRGRAWSPLQPPARQYVPAKVS